MSIAVWLLIAFFVFIFQPKLSLFDYPLDLTIVLVYAYGIRSAMQQSAAVGFTDVTPELRSTAFGAFIGAIEDAMAGSLIGPNFLGKGLVGFISSFIFREIFFQWESVTGGIVLFFLTLLDGCVIIAMRLLFSNMVIGGSAAVELIIIQAIMNIPLGLFIGPGQRDSEAGFMRRLGRRFGHKYGY